MDPATMNAESVRRSLQINVSEGCIETFLSLPPETVALVRASLDDLQRMVLMVIDRCNALRLKAEDGSVPETLCFCDTSRRVCITIEKHALFFEYRDEGRTAESHRFGANYYGQMQLYQQLDALHQP
jgi:hypothetical protein